MLLSSILCVNKDEIISPTAESKAATIPVYVQKYQIITCRSVSSGTNTSFSAGIHREPIYIFN